MLRILVAGNDFDAPIVDTLIAGKVPDRSALTHILDEAGRLNNLTPAEEQALQHISQSLG